MNIKWSKVLKIILKIGVISGVTIISLNVAYYIFLILIRLALAATEPDPELINISETYYLCIWNNSTSLESSDYERLYAPKIREYNDDEDFFIASQCIRHISDFDFTDPKYKPHPLVVGTYYWIIDKSNDSLYGPLTRPRYITLSDSLNINLDLLE